MSAERSEQQSRDDEMLDEYDFGAGVRGKHYRAYASGYAVEAHKADGTIEVREAQLATTARECLSQRMGDVDRPDRS